MSPPAVVSPMLVAALDYAEHGDAVVPIWWADGPRCACRIPACESPAKHPIADCAPHGFHDATTDPATIRQWWTRFPLANIAIPTGRTRTVLDIDPDHGGQDSLAALETKYGTLPPTATTLTGGGGEHRHHAPVPGLRNSVGVIAPGLDIRAEGGYVLVPPSNHVSGGEYANDVTAPLYETPLAPLPSWLLELARRGTGDLGNGRGPVEPPSFTVPPIIRDGTRNDTLYRLVRSLRAQGLSLAGVTAALNAENVARCVPPLPPRETLALLEHAWTQPDRPEFAADRQDPTARADPGTSDIEVIDAADLVAREFTDEPALVGGGLIVPRALVVNGGPAKRGKSLLVLNREIRRALGVPFLGFPTTPGRTLYINAEIPEPQLQQRVVLMLADCPDHGRVDAEALRGHLLTVTHRGLFIDEPAGYDAVRRLIEQTEPDLVSLDPLARFMTGEENSARDVGRLINSLDRLIQEYRIAIELTHHAGKPASNDPRQGGQRLRGSSALFGGADAVTMLDRTQDAWLLTFELRHAEEPAPMPLDRTSSLWFTAAGPPEKLLAVASMVRDLPMRYTTLRGAIIADTKCSEASAQRLIRDAKKAKVIWQGEDGLYRQSIKRYHATGDSGTSGNE